MRQENLTKEDLIRSIFAYGAANVTGQENHPVVIDFVECGLGKIQSQKYHGEGGGHLSVMVAP